MLKLFLVCLGAVAACVALMSFNILRGKEFPETEVSRNKEMRKRGIRCAKEEEMRIWGPKRRRGSQTTCSPEDCSVCEGCNDKKPR